MPRDSIIFKRTRLRNCIAFRVRARGRLRHFRAPLWTGCQTIPLSFRKHTWRPLPGGSKYAAIFAEILRLNSACECENRRSSPFVESRVRVTGKPEANFSIADHPDLEDTRRVSTPRGQRFVICDALNVSCPKAIPRTRCRPRSINPGAHEGDRVPIYHSAKFLAAIHHHEVRCDHTVKNPRCGAIRIDRVSSWIVLSPIRSQWCPV